jgi:hypothetical protein
LLTVDFNPDQELTDLTTEIGVPKPHPGTMLVSYCISNSTLLTPSNNFFFSQDTKPVRMTNEKDFERRMTFIESMLDLNENYRHFDFLQHPAIVERLKVKEEEDLEEDHDEL